MVRARVLSHVGEVLGFNAVALVVRVGRGVWRVGRGAKGKVPLRLHEMGLLVRGQG